MNFQQAFFDELEKVAVKAGGVSFRPFNTDKPRIFRQLRPTLTEAVQRTPVVRAARQLTKVFNHTKNRAEAQKDINTAVTHAGRKLTDAAGKSIKSRPDVFIGGLAIPGRRVAAINMANRHGVVSDESVKRRATIAHEAFHARNPILGRSETLAHAYGGWRKTKGASLGTKVKDAVSGIRKYRSLKNEGTYPES